MRRDRNRRRDYQEDMQDKLENWVPRTKLGRMVKSGEVSGFEQIYQSNMPVLESQIVDALIPNLQEEVLMLKTVRRSTDSGRRNTFMATAAVGNKNGFIGIGNGKDVEPRPAIEKAVRTAKKNIIHIQRGCGSWECACGEDHSLPFKVGGSKASVHIDLMPAPKGSGIVAGVTAKKVLDLAGVKDVRSHSTGSTDTVFNAAIATVNALKQTRSIRRKEVKE